MFESRLFWWCRYDRPSSSTDNLGGLGDQAVFLGGDGAVISLYHLSNNLGSLSFFLIIFIYFCLLICTFFANTISKWQNSKISNFQNSDKHQTPKRVDAPGSTCRCGITSTVVRHSSQAPGARRKLPVKGETLILLGRSCTVYFLRERNKEKKYEQQADNRILVPPTTHAS